LAWAMALDLVLKQNRLLGQDDTSKG